ncbi:hypothetical protein H8E77_43500 [bacterium]|nr:hypothetical protein [bacterium]
MIRRFCLTAMFIIAGMIWFNSYTSACFNPTDFFAAEVVLNKTGITDDIEIFKNAENMRIDDGIVVYLSHYNADVAVVVSKIDDPVIGLSVRLQIPTKTVEVDGQTDLAPAVDIDKDEFDFQTAMKVELEWLRKNMIIAGITDADIKMIAAKAKAGKSGWNSRIVYEEGNWLIYSDTNNSLLIRALGCGGFSIDSVPKNQIVLPNSAAVNKKRKLSVTWGILKIL